MKKCKYNKCNVIHNNKSYCSRSCRNKDLNTGKSLSEKTKNKISKKVSIKIKEQYKNGRKAYFEGKKRPKHSEFMKKNSPMLNPETAKKSARNRKPFKHSESQKKHLSKKMKEYIGKNGNAMQGRKHSKESCKKISKSRKGKHYPKLSKVKKIQHIGKGNPMYGVRRFGKENPNWRGGLLNLSSLIRSSEEYKTWRIEVLKKYNYKCNKCGVSKDLNVHHKIEFADILKRFLKEYNQFSPYEDKETLFRLAIKYKPFWDINNGIVLCEEHHKGIHPSFNF